MAAKPTGSRSASEVTISLRAPGANAASSAPDSRWPIRALTYRVPNAMRSMATATIQGSTAQSRGARFAQPETSNSQAKIGAYQSACAATPYTRATSNGSSGRRAHNGPGATPPAASSAAPPSRITTSTAPAIAQAIAGCTNVAVANFASTVVRSETGSDFQNRMLRSRRSA